MYWSPFISHHKPKLQINIQNGNWHCWVSNSGGRTLFQLLKKLGASKEHFDELRELVDDNYYVDTKTKKTEDSLSLPTEFKPLWNEYILGWWRNSRCRRFSKNHYCRLNNFL